MPAKKKPTKALIPAKADLIWVNESHRNPESKVLNQKKQTIIHDCDAGDGIHVEYTAAGTVVFDQGMAVLPNDGRADDIAAELKSRKTNHRDRYSVVKNRESMKQDNIHAYTFGTVALPWNKYDELGRKIND